eukprot:1201290-Prymnesium_polylepis.1
MVAVAREFVARRGLVAEREARVLCIEARRRRRRRRRRHRAQAARGGAFGPDGRAVVRVVAVGAQVGAARRRVVEREARGVGVDALAHAARDGARRGHLMAKALIGTVRLEHATRHRLAAL